MVRLAFAYVVTITLLCLGVSEEVSNVRKPLVVPLGDQCVFSRDARSLKKRKLDIVRDYYVCNDFSKKRCIYDRDLNRCIPKRLLDRGEDVVSSPMTVSECKERCATISCAERCEKMNYDDAPAGTRGNSSPKGMGKLRRCVRGCATSSCKDRCFHMGYVDFSSLKSQRRRLRMCARQCATQSCVDRCFNGGIAGRAHETKLYRQLKARKEKRAHVRKCARKCKTRSCVDRCYTNN